MLHLFFPGMIVVYIKAQTGFGKLSLSLGMGGYQRCGAQAPAEHARVAVSAPWKLPSSLEAAQFPGIALDSTQGPGLCQGGAFECRD